MIDMQEPGSIQMYQQPNNGQILLSDLLTEALLLILPNDSTSPGRGKKTISVLASPKSQSKDFTSRLKTPSHGGHNLYSVLCDSEGSFVK